MSKLGKDQTTFTGVQENRAKPQSLVRETELQAIAKDQALTYQTIIGEDLDGTSYSGSSQSHDGTTGCLLGHPLSCVDVHETKNVVATVQAIHVSSTLRIDASALGTDATKVIWRWPVFLPDGHSTVYIHTTADQFFEEAQPEVVVYDTAFGEDSRDRLHQGMIPDPSGDPHISYTSQITVSGGTGKVYIFSLEATFRADDMKAYTVYSLRVLPQYWERVNPTVPWGPVAYAVGKPEPERGTSYAPIFDSMCAEDNPLSSFVTGRLAENDAFLHELVTDTPAPGYTTAGTSGHVHSGAGGTTGDTIDLPLYSTCLGYVPTDAADDTEGFRDETEAFYGAAPTLTDSDSDDTNADAAIVVIQTPTSVATATLYWCAVLYDRLGDDGSVTAHEDSTIAGVMGGSPSDSDTTTFTGGAGWQYVTGTLTSASNDLRYIRMQFECDDLSKGASIVSLTGFCLYLT